VLLEIGCPARDGRVMGGSNIQTYVHLHVSVDQMPNLLGLDWGKMDFRPEDEHICEPHY